MKLLNLGCGTRHHPAWINVDLYSTGLGVIPCDLRCGLPFTDNSFDVVYHSHLLEHFSKISAAVFLRECFRVLQTGGIIRVVVPNLEQIVRTYLKLLEEVADDDETQDRYNWITIELLDQMVRNESGGAMLEYCQQDPIPAADFLVERMGSELLNILSSLSQPQKEDKSASILGSNRELNQAAEVEALNIGQFRLSGEVHQWMYDRYSLRVLLEEAEFQDIQICRPDESSIPKFSSYLLDTEEDGALCKPNSLFMEAQKIDNLTSQFFESRQKGVAELRVDRDKYGDQLIESPEKSTKFLLRRFRKKLAELRQDRDNAVEEIHIRDAQLAELREEIHIRDAQLVTLSHIHDQALSALPLVSIITPVLNCAKWIDLCIKSVMMQNYPKIEHIIIDGGSTDGTLEICQNYPHLIVNSQKDRGQSHAINKGFAMAQGDILAWLCSDDEYEPGAVSAAVKGIMAGQNVIMGFSRFIDEQGLVMADHPANAYPYYDYDMVIRFWKYFTISQPATFWTRNIWETCGPLRENLYFGMDYDLWLRMSQKCRFQRVELYTAKYRVHSEAKCIADNYNPRIELIKISRQHWPSKWKLDYWKLHLSYLLSESPITQHFSDGENLLQETVNSLNKSERLKAIYFFSKAHYKHLATPFLPHYKPVLKRILKEAIGPTWFWRLGKKFWYFLRWRNK